LNVAISSAVGGGILFPVKTSRVRKLSVITGRSSIASTRTKVDLIHNLTGELIMATSSCPKCGKTDFEMKEAAKIAGTTHKYMFVQCAACGAVVGLTEHHHIGLVLRAIKESIDKLNKRTG